MAVTPRLVGRARGFIAATAIVASCTAVAWPLSRLLPATNLVMVYLAGVVVAGGRYGRGPSILASFASVLAFDFFCVPPFFSLRYADPRDLLTFIVMLAVGLAMASLTASLRQRELEAALRAERMTALYELTHDLADAATPGEIGRIAEAQLVRVFGATRVALLWRDGGAWQAAAGADAAAEIAATERVFASPAGDGSTALAREIVDGSAIVIPLRAEKDVLAALVITGGDIGVDPSSQRQLLRTFTAQIAGALARLGLARAAESAATAAASERLRSALLTSLSHDLKTPVAVIESAASSLIASPRALTEAGIRERIEIMLDEARHMGGIIGNILEMTRLESATVELRREWYPAEDLISSALTRLRVQLARRTVDVQLGDDLPLLYVDGPLFETLLRNLLENFAKYTPPGARASIGVAQLAGSIVVTVADDGPGLPDGVVARLFEKFVRGPATGGVPGVGLGLAICWAIAHAHGAKLEAGNRSQGGAEFRVTLPTPADQPAAPEFEPG
jgi:two-component system sensor histidine kinase KdpD